MTDGLVYLDNAATTFPKPPGVLREMVETYARLGVSPGRGSHDLAMQADDLVSRTRALVARFFGAPDPERVVFGANATDALNTVIQGLVRPGDHVVATRLEHNSVLRPLHHLAESGVITYDLAPFDGRGFVDPDAVAALIRPKTRAVVMTHASNVLGTIQPLAAIGRVCADHGIPIIVDAAQGAGQVPIDMTELGIAALAFTGHEFAEGATTILDELARRRARASFFLTGDFLRRPEFAPIVRRIVAEGHYLGPHSDKHLLYCAWESRAKTLVTRDELRHDLEDNLQELARFGVAREQTRYWLPAYEWYNADITSWSAALGLTLINFTPGTRSNADYTGERDPNFVSSRVIVDSILGREERGPDGLNGFLLLLHIGAGPGRTDPMHARFGELLDRLADRGYRFVRVDELLR